MEEEIVDIPSDCESIDGLCDSDVNDVSNNESEEIIHSLESNTIDDFDREDEALSVRLQNLDGDWEQKSRPKENVQFAQEFGPNVPDSATSPLDIFYCLFTPDLIDILVDQTNLYREQSQSIASAVSEKELLAFLGINILMGVKRLPSYKDYWSMNPQINDPYISNIMTLNRFSFYLSHLHVNDNNKEPKKGEQNYDKLYKIRPMITKLNENFKNCFKPKQHQTIDESMVKFKGRNSMKQYNAAKPIKRGYKIWVRADETGYVCEFQIYTGKSSDTTEKSLGARVVRDLTREITNRYHQV